MNELTLLERHLESWTPRRPSARLEARLFGAAPPGRSASFPLRLLRWFAPAAGAVGVAAVVLLLLFPRATEPDSLLGPASSVSRLASLVFSNQGLAAEDIGNLHSRHNVWLVASFDWTNASQSLSTVHSFSVWKRDRL